jgi:CHAT domain-containing protein
VESRLSALWRVLVPPPVWRGIRRASEVVVIPDGSLHQVPFEALVTRPAASGHARRYWLDDGPALRYGASASSLCALAGRPPVRGAGPAALSVSDPEFAHALPAATPSRTDGPEAGARVAAGAWAPLPGARRESEAIRRAFSPDSVVVLQGADADEASLRALLAGRRYLHFATHGFVSEGATDLLGGLVLATPPGPSGGTADDGFLQLFEIFELRLDCELAVLSACETQRGVAIEGEGVLALSRGFLTAGARGVVASLWDVSDESTAALVGALFRRIAAAGTRRAPAQVAIALRDARREVRSRAEWSDPFHWAPFVYSGR